MPDQRSTDPLLQAIRELSPAPELEGSWVEQHIARALRAHQPVSNPEVESPDTLLAAIAELSGEDVDLDDDWAHDAIAAALTGHVGPGATTAGPTITQLSAHRRSDLVDPVAWSRFARTLPAAAAGPDGGARHVVTSDDGTITLICEEAPDRRVLLRVDAAERHDDLVGVPWRLAGQADDAPANWLVTPLAPSGGRWVAIYALDAVARGDDIDLAPPRWASISELGEADVRSALTDGAYGAARRAWRSLVGEGKLTGALRLLIEELLEANDH